MTYDWEDPLVRAAVDVIDAYWGYAAGRLEESELKDAVWELENALSLK